MIMRALLFVSLLGSVAFAQAPEQKAPAEKAPAEKAPAEKAPAAKPDSPNKGKRVIFERVVAVINDAIILRSELDMRMIPMMDQVNQIADPKEKERRVEKLRSSVLDEMVNEELIVQAADTAKIEVESAEVQAALDEIKSTNNLDDATLAQALAAQGYTLANYKTDLRRQLLRLRAVNQLVAPKVSITDEDIRAKYDEMQRRSQSVSAVKLSHILFKLPEKATEQQVAEAKAKAAQAMERVSRGEDFAAVAGAVSEDVSTKATGGELGWFQRQSLANPEWEPIVFAMGKGDVRGPVTGPQGLHVFLATDVQTSNLKAFDQMKEQISRELRRKEMDKVTATWLEELRKKAYIDIKLN